MIYLEPRKIYDEFILGIAEGIDVEEPCLIYSKNQIIDHLIDSMGQELILNHNENKSDRLIDINQKNLEMALEYFDFNIAGAYMGPSTPIFMSKFAKES